MMEKNNMLRSFKIFKKIKMINKKMVLVFLLIIFLIFILLVLNDNIKIKTTPKETKPPTYKQDLPPLPSLTTDIFKELEELKKEKQSLLTENEKLKKIVSVFNKKD